jgi:hypothetical protein
MDAFQRFCLVFALACVCLIGYGIAMATIQ